MAYLGRGRKQFWLKWAGSETQGPPVTFRLYFKVQREDGGLSRQMLGDSTVVSASSDVEGRNCCTIVRKPEHQGTMEYS